MTGAIPYSTAPKLTQEQLKQSRLQIALYKKEITLEQAKAQGYKEPKDDIWGLSAIPLDGEK